MITLMVFATMGLAHEQTPAKVRFEPSIYNGIHTATIQLFNRREDVRYYVVRVLDEDMNIIEHISSQSAFELDYNVRKNIDIYVRTRDIERIEYICTESRYVNNEVESSGVRSVICSRTE